MGLFSSNNSYLGIDIGAFGIKIVELIREGGVAKLVSYGFSENKSIGVKNDWKTDKNRIAQTINAIHNKAGMRSRSAVVSLPTFSVFSSIINLSNISGKDLAGAVFWEAKKVIPLPPEEMILDWKEIEKSQNGKNIKVFLTGAPRNLIKKYIEIFKEAKINLLSLETETFSLIRSLIGNDKSTIMIIEIGANSSDIAIIQKGMPMVTRSVDVGGLTITRTIASNLNISLERAEQFKRDLGLGNLLENNSAIPATIIETLAPIVNEAKYSANLFETSNNILIDKIILSGGSSVLINFQTYLANIFNKNVIIGNPWSRISYPVELKFLLEEIGPSMSVAVGLAIREVE